MNAFAWRLRRSARILSSVAAVWSLLVINHVSYRVVGLIGLLMVPASLLSATPEPAPAEQSKEGREAVREALQREVYGLAADREQLLLRAVEAEPKAALPRWYLGQVQSADGKWQSIGKLPSAREGQLWREYRDLRDTKLDDAAGNLALAEWCARKELKQQERAHLLRSLSLNPNQAEVRQRLGLVRVGDQWLEPTILARVQQRQAAARAANNHWVPIVTKLAPQVSSPNIAKRTAAVDQVLAIADAGALPALQAILAPRGEEQQLLVLQVCANLADPSATDLIARHAVVSPSLKIRQTAAEMLKTRDQAAYVPLLISAMYSPVVARAEAISLPDGAIGLRQGFWREGADQQELLITDTRIEPVESIAAWRLGQTDLVERRDRALLAAIRTAAQAEQAVAEQNRLTALRNDRVAWALTIATGELLPAQPDAWWKWWTDLNEISLPDGKSLLTAYRSNRLQVTNPLEVARHECFVAGTPVTTDQGPIAIERIRIGDLVLARDVDSGELAYKPVLRTTLRPQRQLVRLTVGREVFESTGGHLFWVSGEGWVRARDLRPGCVLHTAAGPVRVMEAAEGPVAPTYNLIVADFNTYFVGEQKLLSHDVTAQQPTRAIVPGLLAD